MTAGIFVGIIIGVFACAIGYIATRMLALKESRIRDLELAHSALQKQVDTTDAIVHKQGKMILDSNSKIYALDRDCELMAPRCNVTRYTEK